MPRPERARGAALERLGFASEALRHGQEPLPLLGHARPGAFEAQPEAEVTSLQDGHRRRRLELARADGRQHGPRGRDVEAGEEHRRLRPRQRVEAEGHRPDHGERAERADEEARHVEPGHVLHHLAAALRDGAVGPDEGHPHHQVAPGAVALTQGAPGIGGEDAPHRRALRQRRVEREALTVCAELPLQLRHRHARLDHGDLVRRVVLDDAREPPGAHHRVEPRRRPAQLELGAAADERDRQPVARAGAERLGGLVQRGRLEHEPRDDALHRVAGRSLSRPGHHRSACPESSRGCGM